MTKLVTVRCGYEDVNTPSQLQEISRIRLLKKSTSGWKLLAELRDNEPTPKLNVKASVSAKVSPKIEDNFLQIVWPLANEETFGIYRCDVIGFDKTNFESKSEVTEIVQIVEESVTTNDMLQMFLETKNEMHQIEDNTTNLEGDYGVLDKKLKFLDGQVNLVDESLTLLEDDIDKASPPLNKVTEDATSLKYDVSSMKPKFDSVKDNTRKLDYINSNIESMRSDISSLVQNPLELVSTASSFSTLLSWPAGKYALLQPKTGCPVDLTFLGGNRRYWQIHTESSSLSANRNAHSDVFLPGTLSTSGKNNFATVKFCEANGILNTVSWPSGSYCINRIVDVPCPTGFVNGEVQLDVEDVDTVTEFTSRSVRGGRSILFCCMNSGDVNTGVTLPTHSPFMLYRRGGRCQQVGGMGVSEETLTLDTENSVNKDNKLDNWPDVDIHESGDSIMTFHLCHYERA